MWRGKKVMVIALAALLLVGSSVGVVLAADNGDEAMSPPEAQHWALLDRVCEIYEENTGTTVDQQALQDAFAQARSEIQAEAMQNRLANLVEQGRITQDEADQYLEWWQARPDVPVRFGFRGMGKPLGWGGPGAPTE